MSEDLTQKLPQSEGETLILTAVHNLDKHVRSSFDKLVSWVGSIDGRLKDLKQKVDQRLHDTRPIWHKVVADIALLQQGQERLEEGMGELNATVRELSRDQVIINDVIRKIHLDFHNIDQRLHKLELKHDKQNSST